MWRLSLIFVLGSLAYNTHASAAPEDSSRLITVNRILIIGNKITRDRIILRELSMKSGDTLRFYQLKAFLPLDRNKIYNLRLFNTVEVRALEIGPSQIDLLIEVSERWYTFPLPVFELSDRNFNEWIQNYNADLSRVNYGIKLFQYNLRGRNETLRIGAQFGFSREFDLSYRIPNLDRQQKHGLRFDLGFSEPENIAYFTNDHKLEFLRLDESARVSRSVSITYS
ncbi:MAG: POTRA domain-containing protein, partial [Cyclobacteriaceae bacterium]